jgi:hypothetical protein
MAGSLIRATFFPGYVDPPADSSASNTALILANFEDPDGMNPYLILMEMEPITPFVLPDCIYLPEV